MRAFLHRFQAWLRRLWAGLAWRWIWACDSVVLALAPRPVRGQQVLLVKLDAIGDFVVWLGAAQEFRQIYPGRKITLLANSAFAELAARLPYWDEVLPVDVAQLRRTRYSSYRAQLLRSLRAAGFDMAVQPTYSREFLAGDTLIKASRARERIGSAGDMSNLTAAQKKRADQWYTRLVPAREGRVSEVDRNAEFVRHLGGSRPATPALLPKVAELPERLRLGAPYFILFPGAGQIYRQWPVARFAGIAARLSRQYGWQAVVSGSASEAALCAAVGAAAGVEVVNLAGQTSLPEFVELVRGARLLVGNETSAVHIAGAVGTPSVGILGGGHYGRFMPYEPAADRAVPEAAVHPMPCFHCGWVCTLPHAPGEPMPCIERVTVDEVLEAAERALRGRRAG